MGSKAGRAIRTDFREATELVCAAFEKPGRLRGHASGGGNHFRRAQLGECAAGVLLGMMKKRGEERKPASESSCRMMSPGWAGAKPKESGDRRSADDKIDNSERG